MFKQLMPAFRATLVLALLTGLIFPLVITAISQMLWPIQANGSLIRQNGNVIGSKLIAQRFIQPQYFHPRPSAAGSGYAGEASAASNLGPTSKKLISGVLDDPSTKADESFDGVEQLAAAYRRDNLLAPDELVPVDAVTRSASGLDPDISMTNALLQARRVAKARNMTVEEVATLIQKYKIERDLGVLGEPRVNVLSLNLAFKQVLSPKSVR